jgi:hypothetical protein
LGASRRDRRTLIKREPHNVMHAVALAEVMGHREGPELVAIDKAQEQMRT